MWLFTYQHDSIDLDFDLKSFPLPGKDDNEWKNLNIKNRNQDI